MSATYMTKNTPSSYQIRDHHAIDNQVQQKCISLEREVLSLRKQVLTARNDEAWCSQAGEQALQELKRMRAEVPQIEMERDRVHGENLNLSNEIEQLSLKLQKEIAERDHWKQNITDLKEDLEMLELKQLQDLASIENTRFMQLLTKNTAEQLVINNNTIELENQRNETENVTRQEEKDAAKKNIMFFESERNSLRRHIEAQKEQLEAIRKDLNELGKVNDELNKELDILREENPYLESSNILRTTFRNALTKARSHRSDDQSVQSGTKRRGSLNLKKAGWAERSLGNISSSVSVRSAPIFKFNLSGKDDSKSMAYNGSMVGIDEMENSL